MASSSLSGNDVPTPPFPPNRKFGILESPAPCSLESLNLEQNVLSAEMTKTLTEMSQNVRLDRQRLEHFDEGDRPSVVIWGNTP